MAESVGAECCRQADNRQRGATMPSRFSDDVVRALREAGWHEGRRVDAQDARTYLEEFGFTISPVAADFLAEFHGLHFDLANGPHDFDVRKATFLMEQEEVPFVNKLIEEPLCPVGYGGRCYMLLTPSNTAIFLHDEWLGFIRPMDLPEAMRWFLCCPSLGVNNWVDLADDQKPVGYRDGE
jgi:hypothetical protein